MSVVDDESQWHPADPDSPHSVQYSHLATDSIWRRTEKAFESLVKRLRAFLAAWLSCGLSLAHIESLLVGACTQGRTGRCTQNFSSAATSSALFIDLVSRVERGVATVQNSPARPRSRRLLTSITPLGSLTLMASPLPTTAHEVCT